MYFCYNKLVLNTYLKVFVHFIAVYCSVLMIYTTHNLGALYATLCPVRNIKNCPVRNAELCLLNKNLIFFFQSNNAILILNMLLMIYKDIIVFEPSTEENFDKMSCNLKTHVASVSRPQHNFKPL